MSQILFSNFATTTLAGAITTTSLALAVQSGSGVEFPNPGPGQYFTAVISDAATNLVKEIVKVTAVSGDTFTIVRAQQGTAAANWNAGDLIGQLLTAGDLAQFLQVGVDPPDNFAVASGTNAYTIAWNLTQTTYAQGNPQGLVYFTNANTSTACTLNDGTGAKTLLRADGGLPAVASGSAPADVSGYCFVFNDGSGWRFFNLLTISDVVALAGVVRVTDTAGASTAQALVGTASPAIAAYGPSQLFVVTSAAAITATNPTLNVTGAAGTPLGAKTIVKRDGTPLVAGTTPDIPGGVEFLAALDPAGVNLRLLGLLPSDITTTLAPKFAGRIINVQKFTSSGTYTPTPGMTFCVVEGVGGGAAGGGAGGMNGTSNVSIGAPGTSGCYGRASFTSGAIGGGLVVTIGAGGAPVNNGVGGNGGATYFGALMLLPGGIGGPLFNNTTVPNINSNGNTSAAATGANITFAPGSVQSSTLALSNQAGIGGQGGSNPLGTGGYGSSVNATAAAGTGYGSGGAGLFLNGSSVSGPGGAGAGGIIIVTEYGYTS